MVDRVRITAGSGRVHVVAESRTDIVVEGASTSGDAPEITVQGGSNRVTVRVPEGTDIVVGTESGNVTLDGRLGQVSATTGSADITAEDVASIDERTVSGKLTVAESRGPVRLRTTSAKVRVGRADGAVHIGAVSSSVKVREARAAVTATTVSGGIEVLLAGTEPARLETLSGKIRVQVPAGVRPDLRLTTSGKRRVECETGSDVMITARSGSGSITVAGG